jgi:hypothetical protein
MVWRGTFLGVRAEFSIRKNLVEGASQATYREIAIFLFCHVRENKNFAKKLEKTRLLIIRLLPGRE